MKWTVNIEGKNNQRILVKFEPLTESIKFVGQYKPHDKEWVDFAVGTHSMDVNLEDIVTLIEETYDTMKIRLEAYNNISEGFKHIKTIEIKEDSDDI